jgi:cysteine synthase A
VEVFDNNAIEAAGQLGSDLGFLVGIGLGTNDWAAHRLTENLDGNIATFLPDRAEKYYSTALL